MIKTRYFIQHLPTCSCPDVEDSDRTHCICQHRTPVHTFARTYHWVRADADTVIGYGEFHSSEHVAGASEHEHIAVLPHMHSNKSVKDVLTAKANEHAHFAGKCDKLEAACDLKDNDTTSDFVGKMIDRGHTFLEPNI